MEIVLRLQCWHICDVCGLVGVEKDTWYGCAKAEAEVRAF
jgi:hypothetical protein